METDVRANTCGRAPKDRHENAGETNPNHSTPPALAAKVRADNPALKLQGSTFVHPCQQSQPSHDTPGSHKYTRTARIQTQTRTRPVQPIARIHTSPAHPLLTFMIYQSSQIQSQRRHIHATTCPTEQARQNLHTQTAPGSPLVGSWFVSVSCLVVCPFARLFPPCFALFPIGFTQGRM